MLQNFSASVKSWVTRAMAFLLLEVVDVGGGSPRMFTNLADFTEKNAQLDKERRSMIKPYLMIPYVGAIMVVATTSMMHLLHQSTWASSGRGSSVGVSGTGKSSYECSSAMLVLPSVGNGLRRWEDGRGQRSRRIQARNIASHNQHHHGIRLGTFHRRRLTKERRSGRS